MLRHRFNCQSKVEKLFALAALERGDLFLERCDVISKGSIARRRATTTFARHRAKLSDYCTRSVNGGAGNAGLAGEIGHGQSTIR
jgi:hypothetical protein